MVRACKDDGMLHVPGSLAFTCRPMSPPPFPKAEAELGGTCHYARHARPFSAPLLPLPPFTPALLPPLARTPRSWARVLVLCGLLSGAYTSHSTSTFLPPRMGSG